MAAHKLRRTDPWVRSATARSTVRPTAGGSGTRTILVPLPHTRSTRWRTSGCWPIPASGCTSRRPISSWISQVERWFAELQRRCLDRGVFCSLEELTTALEDWIKTWNASAQPFKWTKTADQIIDRICRYCSRISGPGH
jgi:hypothetical protein